MQDLDRRPEGGDEPVADQRGRSCGRAKDDERGDERPARLFVCRLAGQRLEQTRERQQEDEEQDSGADEAQRLLVRLRRSVEGVGERGNGEDRRRQHSERRDDARAGRVEALEPVAEPADGEGEPENENAVGEDRADQRGLDELDQAVVERKEADEQLGQVAEGRLHGAGARRSEATAELLGREPNGSGEPCNRHCSKREAEDGVPVEKVRESGGHYQDRIDCQLDPLAPADRATLPVSGSRAQLVSQGPRPLDHDHIALLLASRYTSTRSSWTFAWLFSSSERPMNATAS